MAKRKTKSALSSETPEEKQALKMVMQMMAIVGSSGNEGAISQFVLKKLKAAGAKDSQITIEKPPKHSKFPKTTSGNIILKIPGTKRGPRRLFSAHLDTVPVCVGSKPVRKGDRVFSDDPNCGLGADNRAGSAVLLSAAIKLLKKGVSHPPLTFLWTVQEEVGMIGARDVRLASLGNPAFGINYDGKLPTQLVLGATGGFRISITIRGKASHAGGAPEEGISAIAIASLAIADLHKNGWHGLIVKGKKTGTSNVGIISGGAATNVVTDLVTLRAEARSHDPAFRKRIVKEIETAFKKAAKQVKSVDGKSGTVEFEGTLDYDSFKLSPKEPVVTLAKVACENEGHTPELVIANGGLDANWLSSRGIPTITLGCGQHDIHTVSEELDIPEFHLARRLAMRLATE